MDKRIGNICQALGFIEKNLLNDIGVEDMAAASGYSLYHFIRLFNQIVYHTPYDYLIRRRLCEAASMILSTRRKLIDIALDCRFQNAETFTRAFNRVFHTLPSHVRKTGRLDQRLMLRARSAAHLRHYQLQQSLRPQISHVKERIVAGYDFQEDLSLVKAARIAGELTTFFPKNEKWLWVSIFPDKTGSLKPSHMVGCEVDDLSAIPLQLNVKRLPAGHTAIFKHIGIADNLNLTRDFIYQTWAANTDKQLDLSYEVCQFIHREQMGDCEMVIPLKRN